MQVFVNILSQLFAQVGVQIKLETRDYTHTNVG